MHLDSESFHLIKLCRSLGPAPFIALLLGPAPFTWTVFSSSSYVGFINVKENILLTFLMRGVVWGFWAL